MTLDSVRDHHHNHHNDRWRLVSMICQTYYISTGAKSAMFTLRMTRTSDEPHANLFVPDHYICNLANAGEAGEAIALEKARNHTDAMRERIGETDEFKIIFGGFWDEPANLRRGKLSVWETNALETIEAGMFPFGKHRGTKIADAPASYILFFADKLGTSDKIVDETLFAACQGVALENGYISKREADREAAHQLDLASTHVGFIGERREFEGEIVASFFKRYFENEPSNGYYINKVRCAGNLIACIGSVKLGDRGEIVRFKATIKAHDEYKNVKTTKVNRPKLVAA